MFDQFNSLLVLSPDMIWCHVFEVNELIINLQVVAITIFFLLSVAFYAIFSPFLGKDSYKHVAICVYSFLVNDLFALQL